MKFLLSLFLTSFSISFTSFAKEKEVVELAPERTILLAGVISGKMFGPTMSTLNKLAEDKEKPIDIIISSPGGSVIVGSILIDRMEQLKSEGIVFRCIVRDIAASMAFQLLLHCSERYSAPGAFLLWHPVRVFNDGPITADIAEGLASDLRRTDEVVLHDLRAFLPMEEEEMIYHFKAETLHQAFNLQKSAKGFFNQVTNRIRNLYPKEPALDTSKLGFFFGRQQIIYIHERFIMEESK